MIQLKTISQKYFDTSGLCFRKASPTIMNVGHGLTHLSVHCSNAIGMYSCIFVELSLQLKEFEHIATQYYGPAQFWLKGDERLSAVFFVMEIMEMMSGQCQDLKRPQSMAAQISIPTYAKAYINVLRQLMLFSKCCCQVGIVDVWHKSNFSCSFLTKFAVFLQTT